MRYILDNDGYIMNISFGNEIECDLGTCTLYTGKIPTDYETIEEWLDEEIDKLNAWKIVDGNLVFDEQKYEKLQEQYKLEEELNSYASKKYVNDKLSKSTTIFDEELSNVIDGSSLFRIENTKNATIVGMTIKPNDLLSDNLKLYISNDNMLENKLLSSSINGLNIKINEDKSITINGTASDDTELVLNGSLTSEEELFFLKSNQDYIQNGLDNNVLINLYHFDGTDRALISSLGNGIINLSQIQYITCVTLKINSGSQFSNKTIYPMLSIGNEERAYVEHKGNKLKIIDLDNYKFANKDYIEIYRNELNFHKFIGLYPSKTLFPSKKLFPRKLKETIIENTIDDLYSFDENTIVQCNKDVNISVKYFANGYLNERVAELEVKQGEIELEVSQKTDKEYVEGKLQLKLDKNDNDQVVSMLNASADEINLSGNRLVVEADNFSLDKNGNLVCENAKIRGSEITLNDTGVYGDASLKIYQSLSSTSPLSWDIDMSGKELLIDVPETFKNPQNNNSKTIFTTTGGYKVIYYGEMLGSANHTYGWDFYISIVNNAGTFEKILYHNSYLTDENTETVDIDIKKYKLPSDFGSMSGRNLTEFNSYISIITDEKVKVTSYSASGIKADITTDYDFTTDDITKIANYIKGTITLTEDEKLIYDLNKDGIVDMKDLVLCQKIILNGITKSSPGELIIDTTSTNENFKLIDGDGNVRFSCGFDGLNFNDSDKVDELLKRPLKIDGYIPIKTGMNDNLEIIDLSIVDDETPYIQATNSADEYGITIWQSDKRLKENIEDSNYKALDTINKIKHRKFKYKNKDNIVDIGYVADELEEIDKNMIFEVGKEKIKQPKESYLIPVLSKAIQELSTKIDELEKEIIELKKESEK